MIQLKTRQVGGSIKIILATLLVSSVTIGVVSGIIEQRDAEHDRERRVVLRWEVESTRPAHVVVIATSSMRGAQTHFEGSSTGLIARDVMLIKNEQVNIVVSGELPISVQRGTVTCRLYENGRRIDHHTRVIRGGDHAGGVKCEATVTG